MKQPIFLFLAALTGCASQPGTWSVRQPASVAGAEMSDEPGEFQDTGTLTAKHYHMLISQTISSLDKNCKTNKGASHAISSFTNMSPLDLDIQLLTRTLQDSLFEDHWKLTDISSRPEVFSEYEYQQSDMVNPATAIQKGKQLGVEYILRPAITAQSTQNEKEKITRISLRLQMVRAETATIECNAVGSIVQKYDRQKNGF